MHNTKDTYIRCSRNIFLNFTFYNYIVTGNVSIDWHTNRQHIYNKSNLRLTIQNPDIKAFNSLNLSIITSFYNVNKLWGEQLHPRWKVTWNKHASYVGDDLIANEARRGERRRGKRGMVEKINCLIKEVQERERIYIYRKGKRIRQKVPKIN